METFINILVINYIIMKKTVLVVDDEPSIVELEKSILESIGCSVITANNGTEALKILKKEKVSLVVLDMMMPGMSGREVCEEIRKISKLKKLKIVFVTVAKFSDAGQDVLKKMGVSDYITKPFEVDDLIKRIKKHLVS